jgi:hypothetical protein
MTLLFFILGVVLYFALIVLVGWAVGFNRFRDRSSRFPGYGMDRPVKTQRRNPRARANVLQLHRKSIR